jgi:hypothetical protein
MALVSGEGDAVSVVGVGDPVSVVGVGDPVSVVGVGDPLPVVEAGDDAAEVKGSTGGPQATIPGSRRRTMGMQTNLWQLLISCSFCSVSDGTSPLQS